MRTLTSVQEDYLRAIFSLGNGAAVKPVAVARYLGLAKQTVTERLRDLSAMHLVMSKRYGSVSLTTEGLRIAQALTYKHRVIESFLYTVLQQPKGTIHEEAHRLEHAFSDSSIEALYRLLGRPTTDPHGSTISTL